jgi:hypothetical protein
MAKAVKNKANDLQGLRIVTVHQFASDFLTSYQTALKWLKEHEIPVHKIGSKAWVYHNDLITYFQTKMMSNQTKLSGVVKSFSGYEIQKDKL